MALPTLKLLAWIFLSTISLLALGLTACAGPTVKSGQTETEGALGRSERQQTKAVQEYVRVVKKRYSGGICDRGLQSSLIRFTNVGDDSGKGNELIQYMQTAREHHCNKDQWNPTIGCEPNSGAAMIDDNKKCLPVASPKNVTETLAPGISSYQRHFRQSVGRR